MSATRYLGSPRWPLLVVVTATATACGAGGMPAGSLRGTGMQPVQGTVSVTGPGIEPAATDGSLEAYCQGLTVGGEAATARARALGIPLGSGQGARAVTGDPAVDDTVATATVASRVGSVAAVLVQTACGNAHLAALRWVHGTWQPSDCAGLVVDARPGGCRTTDAHAEGRGMASAERREIVTEFGSASEEGDEVRAPVLRVYQLSPQGRLEVLSGDLPFGGSDDETGAAQRAEWAVDEALQLPRELYVQLAPGRPGPGGTAVQVVVRRTYRLQNGELVLVDESTEAYRPPRTVPSGDRSR